MGAVIEYIKGKCTRDDGVCIRYWEQEVGEPSEWVRKGGE
jgi:hypothetical protein